MHIVTQSLWDGVVVRVSALLPSVLRSLKIIIEGFLFHHLTILRGNWVNKTEKIVATLGFENDASPIKLIDKSIKESKGKTPSISKFGKTMDNESKLRNLKNLKTDFHYMSIIPLPQLLMKTFMEL